MTARLPTPGGDNNIWGSILNTFLEVSHNSDGTLQSSAILQAGGLASSQVGSANGVAGLNNSSQVPTSQLGSGSASSSNFLRGDGVWAAPSAGGVTAFNTRTGAVTPQAGDYTFSQIGSAQGLVPTAVKTGAYTASPGDFVPVDASGGSVNIILPTTPADKSRVEIKMINTSGNNTVTIHAGGSDVFNKSGGGTSATLTLLNQALTVQYTSSGAIWYTQSDDLPLSQLDGRYSLAAQPWQFPPEAYGAKGNGRVVADGAMTSGLNTLTCSTSAPFTSADVGKVILVNGAGAQLSGTSTNSALSTTITGFTSASQVTLGANASATISGAYVSYGSDDTAAINSAISAASTYATANNYYAEIIFKPMMYMIAGALIQGGSSKTNSQIPLPVVPINGNPTMTLAFIGTRNNAGTEMFQGNGDNPAPANEGTVLKSTIVGATYSGTYGQPAVIGGPTVEQGYTGAFTNLWNNLMVVVDGITVLVPGVASISGIDLTSCVKAEVQWFKAMADVPAYILASGSSQNPVWSGGQSYPKGLVTPQGGNNAYCVVGSFTAYGFAVGIEAYEHTTFTNLTTILCGVGMYANGNNAGHGITGLKWSAEANNTHLAIVSSGDKMPVNIVSMQAENVGQFSGSGYHIDDHFYAGYGRIGIQTSQGENTIAILPTDGGGNVEVILDRPQVRGFASAPAMPSSGTVLLNPLWRHATVNIQPSGATITGIAVDGGTLTGILAGVVRVPSGSTIAVTYSGGTPTWQWVVD